jgi:ABC-type Zn uptake system ZnuABC Zn-binding protein ZnuA
MTRTSRFSAAAWVALGACVTLLQPVPILAQDGRAKISVVATLPTYASIAREIAGDRAEVLSIARGDEDAHFVSPRPSFARQLQSADLFISTGLDLELWVPGLLDRANNPTVMEGAPGHVVAYSGIELLDVPASVSRSGGDVHVFGNPHIHTDPVNGVLIGRNILAGLKRVDPNGSAEYEARARDFEERLLRRVFGDELVDMLGAETLFGLARSRQFWKFAEGQEFQGRPLTEYVGGWLQEAAPFRGRRMVCYHKNWAYFSARFEIECAMYVEPKPGIPASPGHVRDVISFMETNSIPVLFAANYFSQRQVELVAQRSGALPLRVPEHVDGEEGVDDYFALFDAWIPCLAAAFQQGDGTVHRCPQHHP